MVETQNVVQELLDLADNIMSAIYLANCSDIDWNIETYSKARTWALRIEQLIENVPEQNEAELDQKLLQLKQKHPYVKSALTSSSLTCARHLLFRVFLNSPFICGSLLKNVILDFLNLTMGTENPEIIRESAKNKLVEDLCKRTEKQSNAYVLLSGAKTFEDLFCSSNSIMDFQYPFQPHTITKQAYAKLIKRDLVKFFPQSSQVNQKSKEDFVQKLKNSALADISCLETLCFTLIPPISTKTNEPDNPQMVILLVDIILHLSEQSSLFWLHPWILTELSHHHFLIFKAYVSHLVVQLFSLSKEDTHLNKREEIQLRFACLLYRSNQLRFATSQILVPLLQSPKQNILLNPILENLPLDNLFGSL